jgi:hypothetical protein
MSGPPRVTSWIDRMKAEPYLVLPGTVAWLRGIWCKVWFPLSGRRSMVLHGASIGDDSVIGACSLVRKDVPSGVLAAGNPLRIVQSLTDE